MLYNKLNTKPVSIHLSPVFLFLGYICMVTGSVSYIGNLFALRKMMMLSLPTLLLQGALVLTIAFSWVWAVSLYTTHVMVIIPGLEESDNCEVCSERRAILENSGSDNSEDDDGKSSEKKWLLFVHTRPRWKFLNALSLCVEVTCTRP